MFFRSGTDFSRRKYSATIGFEISVCGFVHFVNSYTLNANSADVNDAAALYVAVGLFPQLIPRTTQRLSVGVYIGIRQMSYERIIYREGRIFLVQKMGELRRKVQTRFGYVIIHVLFQFLFYREEISFNQIVECNVAGRQIRNGSDFGFVVVTYITVMFMFPALNYPRKQSVLARTLFPENYTVLYFKLTYKPFPIEMVLYQSYYNYDNNYELNHSFISLTAKVQSLISP